jgi:hypothetical protein
MCDCQKKRVEEYEMNDLTKYAIPLGMLFVAYKYGNTMVKAAALAVAANAVAKRVPYLNTVL